MIEEKSYFTKCAEAKCPDCDGKGYVQREDYSCGAPFTVHKPCPVCHGTRVRWPTLSTGSSALGSLWPIRVNRLEALVKVWLQVHPTAKGWSYLIADNPVEALAEMLLKEVDA